MSFKVGIVVLGLFGCYVAVPIDPPPYDPRNFYPSNRILGGIEAPDGSAPHMVALLVGDMLPSLMCGGSMISRNRVLTAAHCIEPMRSWTGGLLSSARAVLGTNKWSDERRTAQFSGYTIHPEYDRWIIKNDIGVMKLAKNVALDELVQVIAINFDFVGGGKDVSATGWGTTEAWGPVPDRLQLLHVITMSPAQCEDSMREAEAEVGFLPPVDAKVEMCTTHKRGAGYGWCHGDSGSAVVDPLGLQVGLVSWGVPCGRGHPDVNVRLSAYKQFLQAEMTNSD